MPQILADDDRDFIAQALRHAATVYEQDARKMDELNQPRISEMFLQQAERARRLADAIDCGANFAPEG